VVIIGGVWLALGLLANPTGEFPLDDDWSYARAVESLVRDGRFELTGFTAMPLVAQIAWGALFCVPFGFSFTALRVSTWMLGLVGLWATYGLMRTLRPPRVLALVGTLVLAANPLYFVLAMTFMTDVPFVALSAASLALLTYGLRSNARWCTLIALTLAFFALFIRQLAAVIFIAYAVTSLHYHGLTRKTALAASLPCIGLVLVLAGYELFLRRVVGLPRLYNRPYDPILESASPQVGDIALTFAARTATELLYIGAFVLPLSIIVAAFWWERAATKHRLRAIGATLAGSTLATSWLLWSGQLMPSLGNVMYNVGLGPPLLRDVYLLGLPHLPRAPREVWLIVTAAAVLGATVAVQQVLASSSRVRRTPRAATHVPVVLSAIAGALYLGAAAATGFLDRYLVWLIPPISVCAAACVIPAYTRRTPVVATGLAVTLLAAYCTFSVAATHDYFAWNRSRWQALSYLTQGLEIGPARLDGGFEFNGWSRYDTNYRERTGVSWWWVEDDEYILAFGPIDGYTELLQFPYARWLPPGEGDIVVLHRRSAQATVGADPV
jgi:hypothetical protein